MAQVRAIVVLTIFNTMMAHWGRWKEGFLFFLTMIHKQTIHGASGVKTFRVHHQKRNYSDADKACKTKNQSDHLAKIRNADDLQLAKNISNTTNGMKYWTSLHVWIGDWKWSDNNTAGIQLIDVVNNFNRTEAQSKEPRKLCCMVTHDTLLECTNCSEEHAFICEDFQESNFTQVDTNSSCVPAFPPVEPSARNASCIFYEYKDTFCKDIITSLYVYGNQSTLDYGEKETNTFGGYFKLFDISPECRPVMRNLHCRYHFPACDETLDEPKDRGLCRSSCLYLMQDVCKSEMKFLTGASKEAPVFDQKMINCSLYKPANGGDAPECYGWPDIPGDDTKTTDCYYGVGVGYRGNVNVTRSGRTCQSWKSQCPHRHWRIPKDVAKSKNDSNLCRNPDSSAPDGPWCYTTDPHVRWEYCNVSRCPPRELPPPPRRFTVENVQTRYFILTWNEPENASLYQIQNYAVERRTSRSENFILVKTVPYPHTQMILENLDPSTEYTIRLSSNNMYGRSEGVLVTQRTLPDRFIRKLMLQIVLPLSLASLFVVVVCIKYGPIRNSKRGKVYSENQTPLSTLCHWVEIPRTNVTLQEKLGEGAFGEVYKGEVRMGGQVRACAIKTVKENARERERKDLINELQIMVTVGDHPNVVSLIGACTKSGSILVIVRLAPNGCLLNQLKNRENPYEDDTERQVGFTRVDKVRIARDVACGMSHLASKKCVHRDLAARNVLLGDRNVAMVSDFGMSRDVYESGEYETLCRGMLPVRWMALESLEDLVYNTKTDVWSFGVLLWEIESRGKMPYTGLIAREIVEFLRKGKKLSKPEGCPNEIYDLMRSCWNLDPAERPSFAHLLTRLEEELTKNKADVQEDI